MTKAQFKKKIEGLKRERKEELRVNGFTKHVVFLEATILVYINEYENVYKYGVYGK